MEKRKTQQQKLDRNSPQVALEVLRNLMPDKQDREFICRELAGFWRYASERFPEKTRITLNPNYVRLNVGMVELFVIHRSQRILLVMDKTLVDPTLPVCYRSAPDAMNQGYRFAGFRQIIDRVRPAVLAVVEKLAKSRLHPTGHHSHSPGLVEILEHQIERVTQEPQPESAQSHEFIEGARQTRSIETYERDPAARAACLAHYGTYGCQICGFDFERVYGPLGREFIHVHHLRPVSTLGADAGDVVDPLKDLLPVCPNCHAMLHRRGPEPISPEELKTFITKRKVNPVLHKTESLPK